MHALTCTIGLVLPPPERMALRTVRHDGWFPFWPEHLAWFLSFQVAAAATTRELWAEARRALVGLAEIPDFSAVDVRRLHGVARFSPGSSLEVVVLAVTRGGRPLFQVVTAAAGCPVGFGRAPSAVHRAPTVRMRIP